MQLVRLQKALAQAGIASRRAAEELIRQGRVSVNGRVVTEMGEQVDLQTDMVCVDQCSRVRSATEALSPLQ